MTEFTRVVIRTIESYVCAREICLQRREILFGSFQEEEFVLSLFDMYRYVDIHRTDREIVLRIRPANETLLKTETSQFSRAPNTSVLARVGTASKWLTRGTLRSFTNPLIGTYARGDAYAHIYAPLPLTYRGLIHTSVILAAKAGCPDAERSGARSFI